MISHSLPLKALRTLLMLLPLFMVACGGGTANTTAPTADPQALASPITLAQLGQMIFTDNNLSEPRGTACAACHQATMGFAGNHGSTLGVALGSKPGSIGLRNAMTNSYMGFVPAFEFLTVNNVTEASGGHFWDGRADTLELQALGPLLNPLEMNNPDKQSVLNKIASSRYAGQFKAAFGADIFSNTELAFTQIGVAIAAFERTDLQPFTSKYDAMVRGQNNFTPGETRGMALFQDPLKANCAGCHLMNPGSGKPQDSLFSEFTYYATGIPRNTSIPRNADPAFFDLGLCGPDRTSPTLPASAALGVTIENFCGQFRMPTLRNVAERPAFMHNGFFRDLSEVVSFYATRNSEPTRWYGNSGVANDLPVKYLGNIETVKAPFNRMPADGPALDAGEIRDIVAFLHTLSDGYRAP